MFLLFSFRALSGRHGLYHTRLTETSYWAVVRVDYLSFKVRSIFNTGKVFRLGLIFDVSFMPPKINFVLVNKLPLFKRLIK